MEKQAICKSRENTTVIKFVEVDSFKKEIQEMIYNGDLWGVYYNDNDEIVAEDIWGDVHYEIFK